jgi:putative nucleotidyltransferase with HDIG domain
MIPTKEECLNLMKKYNMLENIVNHSLLVNSVALYLSEELNKRGENINLLKVQAGALLHDITKTRSIETGEDHAKAGSALLKILGYNSISEIVRQHVIINDTVNLPGVSEIEVVYYADKRVKHEEVVTLEERFDDLRKRYATTKEKESAINLLKKKAIELEEKIFSRLDMTPDALLEIH